MQELLLFIMLTEFQALKTSEGNGLCSSEKHERARFFPRAENTTVLSWFIGVVVACSLSLLPRATYGKSRIAS